MAAFVQIPLDTLAPETLRAMLEEYATRDGTDYGLVETALHTRCEQLGRQLSAGTLRLLYDLDSETWDLVDGERAAALLAQGGAGGGEDGG